MDRELTIIYIAFDRTFYVFGFRAARIWLKMEIRERIFQIMFLPHR